MTENDKLTSGQLRHMAHLFSLPITFKCDDMRDQTLYPTAHLSALFNAEADVLEKAAANPAPAPQDDALWLCVPDNSPEYKSKGGHLAPVGFTLAEVREFVDLGEWRGTATTLSRYTELRDKLLGGAR